MKTVSHALQASFVLLLTSVAGMAQASLIATDAFNYSSGPLAGNSGGTGWSTGWVRNGSGAASVNAGTGLTYTDNLGNGLVVASNEVSTNDVTTRNLTAPLTATTVWASILVDPTAASPGDGWGLLLNNSAAGGQPNSSILIGRSGLGTTYDVSNWTGSLDAASSVLFQNGTTALLVGEFQINSDNSVTATLFVNPTLSAATPTGGVSITQPVVPVGAFGPLTSIQLFTYQTHGTYIAADLRIGTTYADVTPFTAAVPEPSAAVLLGLAGVLGLGWRFARGSVQS